MDHCKHIAALAQPVLDLVELEARDGLVGCELGADVVLELGARGLWELVGELPDLAGEAQDGELQL